MGAGVNLYGNGPTRSAGVQAKAIASMRPSEDISGDRRRHRLAQLLGGFAASSFSVVSRHALQTTLPGTRLELLRLRRSDGADVRAILSGPLGAWRSCPAVLYCHAHGNRYDIGAGELMAGRPALMSPPYAQALAARGVVALCIDLPCFGERQGETEAAAAKRHLWHGTTLFGEMLQDLAGAMSVVAALDGVDVRRISAFGISMGATLSFWLAALDARIAGVAQLCCFADLETLVSLGAHDLHGIYMTVPGLLPLMRTGEIAGMVAPRPQVIGIGLKDPLTPPAALERALVDVRSRYEHLGASDRLRIILAPDVAHVETQEMRDAAIALACR